MTTARTSPRSVTRPNTTSRCPEMELYEQVDRRTDTAQARDMRTLGRLWMPVPTPIPLRLLIRGALLNALAYTGGHQDAAARCLEISERVMQFQMLNYDIPTQGNPGRLRARPTGRLPSIPDTHPQGSARTRKRIQAS